MGVQVFDESSRQLARGLHRVGVDARGQQGAQVGERGGTPLTVLSGLDGERVDQVPAKPSGAQLDQEAHRRLGSVSTSASTSIIASGFSRK